MPDNFIQHIQRYISLDEQNIQLVMDQVKTIPVKKKDFLLKEGQVCKSNLFVEKGCLRMFFINEKGAEQTTQFAIENWWLTDNMSLLYQKPSGFFIQAIEHSVVVAIDNTLVKKIPQLETYFRIMFQRAYAAAQMRIKFHYSYSREELYKNFIAAYPEFAQRIPQYMLASYLGFTAEYLSELRKKFSSNSIS